MICGEIAGSFAFGNTNPPHEKTESTLLQNIPTREQRERGYLINNLRKKIETKTSFFSLVISKRISKYSEEIIEIFKNASKEELNFLMCSTSLRYLFKTIKDRDYRNESLLFGSILGSFLFTFFFKQSFVNHRVLSDLVILLVSLLFYLIAISTKIGSKCHRSNLMKLLCYERIEKLDYISKSILLDAICRTNSGFFLFFFFFFLKILKTGSNFLMFEEYADMFVNVLSSMKGEELWESKLFIDSGATIMNVHKMVNLLPSEQKKKVIEHFSTQHQKGAKGMTVLSDIDDTLYCSGGDGIAGLDKRLQKHQIYPGVLSLYRELHIGLNFSDSKLVYSTTAPILSDSINLKKIKQKEKSTNNLENNNVDGTNIGVGENLSVSGGLVFLSARPHVYKDLTEKQSYKLFKELVYKHKMHTMPTLLPGFIFYI